MAEGGGLDQAHADLPFLHSNIGGASTDGQSGQSGGSGKRRLFLLEFEIDATYRNTESFDVEGVCGMMIRMEGVAA
jgi:hypothetical protein